MSEETFVVDPLRFQTSMLTSTNATNAESLWVAGSYALGAKVLYVTAPTKGWMKSVPMLRVFESLAAANTGVPVTNPDKWLDIGPANTVAMFTSRIAEKTQRAGNLSVIVAPNAFITTVAFFGLVGDAITLTVRAVGGSVRTTQTKDLITRTGVFDLLSYLYTSFEQQSQALFVPISCLPGDTLEVLIEGANTACSRMIFGRIKSIGSSPEYGATWEMDNWTSADEDEFGYVDPLVKDYAPRQNVAIYVDVPNSNFVLDTLIRLRGTPTLVIFTDDPNYLNAMVNFGLIRDPRYSILGFDHNILDFEFKGFV